MRVMRTPKSVDLDVTNKCNLRCKYCAHFSGAGDVDQDLPKEEWLQFFEELNRCAVTNVCISGGEPFVRKDLKELIEGIVRNRMRFNILSNGTLLTDDWASFLASTGRCNSVQVSIDGSTSETHDSFCGDGVFDTAVRGIQSLKAHNLPVAVRVTIHRHNVTDLEEIARLLLEDLGIPAFTTNAASYMGLCREYADEVQLTVEERSLAMKTLLELSKKYEGRISAAAGPLAEARQWMRMERARREGIESPPACGHLSSCGGVYSKMAVRADGVMVPCNQLSHIELGRINHDGLEDVWQNHIEMARIRERSALPLADFEYCKGCDYIDHCRGNCPALAYNLVGDENHPSPDACLRKFLEEGGSLPDESVFEKASAQ
jgi:SynChlorMet cassette radical SAM/SPASM protein ScmE